jgi:hypothetical protein
LLANYYANQTAQPQASSNSPSIEAQAQAFQNAALQSMGYPGYQFPMFSFGNAQQPYKTSDYNQIPNYSQSIQQISKEYNCVLILNYPINSFMIYGI